MKISNWNGRPSVKNPIIESIANSHAIQGDFCPRGNGRSYGDASLNQRIVTCVPNRETMIIENAILHISSGYTAGDILNYIVPKKYMFPVIPGTQHATVGGMIAADVHGKNHSQNGTIGKWITAMEIQLPNGEIIPCSPDENKELFNATIGGLGLTGIIISAKFKLIPLNNTEFRQKVLPFDSVNALLKGLLESKAPHVTGWFDFYRMNDFLLLENYPEGEAKDYQNFRLKKANVTIPFRSFSLVQPWGMKRYNKRYASRLKKTETTISLGEAFFPLDHISNWNYLYGKRGFYQLQFSLEIETIEENIASVLKIIFDSGQLPTLAVLKKHGDVPSPGILSFPKPGFSFAFDFTAKKGTEALLKQLNRKIADLGGRVYLVKDALLDVTSFEKMYPEAEAFKSIVSKYNDGSIASLLSKRLNLTP